MESVIKALLYDMRMWKIIQGRVVPIHCPHYFNIGRNQLHRKFIEAFSHECKVFVSLDTDHAWTPEQLMELIAHVDPIDRPIVSGRYYACDDLGAQVRPVAMRRKPDGSLESVWDMPKDQLVEVDVVGMGFCAISTELLLGMSKHDDYHAFDFDMTGRGDFMPEDNAFCQRAQQLMGAKIYVHTGIDIGHIKPFELRAEHERQKVKK